MNRYKSNDDPSRVFVPGRTGTTGKKVVRLGCGFKGRAEANPATDDGVTALHVISAIRALGSLCAEVGNILDAQSKTGSLMAPRRPTRNWPEERGVSLNSSTFVDPEDEEANIALPI